MAASFYPEFAANPQSGICRPVGSSLRQHTINLALQGGGALVHSPGAAGSPARGTAPELRGHQRFQRRAMNALALAHGWPKAAPRAQSRSSKRSGPRSERRRTRCSPLASEPSASTGLIATPSKFLLGLTRFFSPYQLNPFDINPLRSIIERLFDFDLIRRASPVRLFVGATQVKTGALRIFRERELSVEHLLPRPACPP